MAISLVTSPDFYKPAYNIIEWKFSSTNVNQCDFQYICELYVNGSFAVSLVSFPDENNHGVFHVQRSLQDYMSFNLHENLIGFTNNDQSICSYQLKIKEQYNSSTDCTGASTTSAILYTSSLHYAWNGALQYKEYLSGPLPFVCTNGTSKFLTNMPNRTKIRFEDYFTISFLQDVGTSPGYDQVDSILIRTYDQNHNLLRTETIVNPYYTPSNQFDLSLSVGVGPENINSATLFGSPAPSQPLISTGVKYYSICLLDSSGDAVSEVKEFEIDNRCTAFTNYRLWWKNRRGTFDSYNFNLKSERKVNISRETYDASFDTIYSEGDRGTSVARILAEETVKFISNWMTEAEGRWLEELFTSDEVYVIDNSDIERDLLISGFVYNAGFTDFNLPAGVILPNGTAFTYRVDDGAPLIADSGQGVITGYSAITGRHSTNLVAAVNAGVNNKGVLTATVSNSVKIPLVILSTVYEEKTKPKKSINYTVETKVAYKLNV